MADHGNLERYRDFLSPAEMARLFQAVKRPLMPAIRVNTLKISVGEARQTWPEWYGWQVQPVPFCAEGWQIAECAYPPGKTLEHRLGFYYIQDAASMLPAELFRFDEAERPVILDMAASPGGKTTHLACKVNDRGLVVANDASASRIPALRANLQDWGTTCTAITSYPGERFGGWFCEAFDKVLLDAPCSGESLRTAERRKSRPISAKERQRLHQRQVALLTSAFQALKPGGELVYATCTMAPEENEAVLDAFLRSHPQEATIEPADHVLLMPAPGLASDGERKFHPQVRRAARLWPHLYDTSGFFVALILKRDSVPVHPQPPPRRSWSEAGLTLLSSQEQGNVVDYLLQTYGFDLGAVVEKYDLTLWKQKQYVRAIPELFLSRFPDLTCVSAGMPIGEQSEQGFAPSNELVARFSAQFTGNRLKLSDKQAEIWLAGRDLRGFDAKPFPPGAVILLEDDRRRFLGLGKLSAQRIRNMLPRRWIY